MDRYSHPQPQYIKSYMSWAPVDNYENKNPPMYSYAPPFRGYDYPIYDPIDRSLNFSLPLENWPPMTNENPQQKVMTIYPGMNP